MIRLGTLFSGIGAIEQALLKMGVAHRNVFACDNGELELNVLCNEDLQAYNRLKKIASYRISPSEKNELMELMAKEQEKLESYLAYVRTLKSTKVKNNFVDDLYARNSCGENLVKRTYVANYKINEEDFHLDVRLLDGKDYENKVDLMVGGSPCQSFSSNGKRGGIEDTRGTLFHHYARIISEVKPKCFIFENVRGMLVHDGGRTWEVIKKTFKSLDYDIYLNHDENGKESPLLNACDYGIPQNRLRIYLVGIRNDIKLKQSFSFPSPIKLMRTNKDFLEESVAPKYYLGQKGFEFVTTHPTRAQVGRSIQKCQKANQQFNWNGDFIFEPLNKRKHTKEILERAFIGEWNGRKGVIRMYTPRECLRLMGYPDTFVMPHSDNVMWRQSGNSIVVNVLEHIFKSLKKTGVFG